MRDYHKEFSGICQQASALEIHLPNVCWIKDSRNNHQKFYKTFQHPNSFLSPSSSGSLFDFNWVLALCHPIFKRSLLIGCVVRNRSLDKNENIHCHSRNQRKESITKMFLFCFISFIPWGWQLSPSVGKLPSLWSQLRTPKLQSFIKNVLTSSCPGTHIILLLILHAALEGYPSNLAVPAGPALTF